jgi:hypothetical protein
MQEPNALNLYEKENYNLRSMVYRILRNKDLNRGFIPMYLSAYFFFDPLW